MTTNYFEKFWDRVDKTGSEPQHVRGIGGCWNWTAGKLDGYGRFCPHGERPKLAHRISWEIKNGTIPIGLFVLHKCDNRACVNPDHLFIGTKKDNSDDKIAKGRARGAPGDRNGMRKHPESVMRGRTNPSAKLCEDSVRKIRDSLNNGIPYKALADKFGVAKSLIWHIKFGRIWRHV